jgi:hypothetical protein
MTAASKLKISLSLDPSLVALADREAKLTGSTRSGVIELWMRRQSGAEVARQIDDATAAYYTGLREAEASEAYGIARASSSAAQRLRIDGPASPKEKTSRRKK